LKVQPSSIRKMHIPKALTTDTNNFMLWSSDINLEE